ncbi:hypothetical protein ACHAWF_001855 [Thalassiosira exigua]
MHEVDRDVSYTEFEKALVGLANDKAPGENGVSRNLLLKALDDDNRAYIYNLVVGFWEGKDFVSWHMGLLSIIPKAGKDGTDLNNFRYQSHGLMSPILNDRLFSILDVHGTKLQFGRSPEVGSRGEFFTLKTTLHTWRNHGLSTHVAFIDLVKAYDIANHELLIRVLKSLALPPQNFLCYRAFIHRSQSCVKIGQS